MDLERRILAAENLARLPNTGPALRLIKMILQDAPGDARVLRLHACCLRSADRLREAEVSALAAIAADPEDPDAVCELAWLRSRQTRWAACRELVRTTLRMQPTHDDALRLEVLNDELDERWEDAETASLRLLTKDPEDDCAHVHHGMALLGRGRTSEAQAAFERALHIEPDNAEARNGMAHVALSDRDRPRALEHVEAAARADPGQYDEDAHEIARFGWAVRWPRNIFFGARTMVRRAPFWCRRYPRTAFVTLTLLTVAAVVDAIHGGGWRVLWAPLFSFPFVVIAIAAFDDSDEMGEPDEHDDLDPFTWPERLVCAVLALWPYAEHLPALSFLTRVPALLAWSASGCLLVCGAVVSIFDQDDDLTSSWRD